MKIGILFRLASAWVGVHYSPWNKRVCVNLVPFVTIWVTLKGGNTPSGPDYVMNYTVTEDGPCMKLMGEAELARIKGHTL
jgi:hypothetical protein